MALVRVPFYFINLLPTSLLYISILLTAPHPKRHSVSQQTVCLVLSLGYSNSVHKYKGDRCGPRSCASAKNTCSHFWEGPGATGRGAGQRATSTSGRLFSTRQKCLVPIKVNRGTCWFNGRHRVCACGASGLPGIKSRTVRVQPAVRA